MCLDPKTFEQYTNRMESLIGEVRIDSLELKDNVNYIKGDVSTLTDDVKDVKRDISEVRRDMRKTQQHLGKMNGRVGKCETSIHDIELARSPEYRQIGCPQADVIKAMSESLLTEGVLKSYIIERDKKHDRKMAIWVGIATVVFTVIAVFIQLIL